MDYELNDQDRADLVRRFFKRYGLWLMIAIIAIALGFGIDAYMQKRDVTISQNASTAYQAMMAAAQNGANDAQVSQSANELIKNYPNTVYATLTHMVLANIAIRQDNLAGAENILSGLLKQKTMLTPIITLRLARVFIADNKPADAIQLLQDPPAGFEASYHLLAGDAFLLQNNQVAAKTNYLAAQKASANDPVITPLITERLNSLGGNS